MSGSSKIKDSTLVVVIGLVASVIGVFTFVTGQGNLQQALSWLSPTREPPARATLTLTATAQAQAQTLTVAPATEAQILAHLNQITSYRTTGTEQSIPDGTTFYSTSELNTSGLRQVYRDGEGDGAKAVQETVVVGTDSCSRKPGTSWECVKSGGYNLGTNQLRQIVTGTGYLDQAETVLHGVRSVDVGGRPCLEYWMEQKRGDWISRDEVAFDLSTYFPVRMTSSSLRMDGGTAKQGMITSHEVVEVNGPVQITLPQ